MKPLKVGIIQEKPIYGDLTASLEKVILYIAEAAAKESQLIVFGETWLCGYPA